MLIALPPRLPVHVLDYGYLVDASGEPLPQLGRGTLRVSADFPEACTAHALPGRLAAHVCDLRVALEDTAEQQRALLILPSYSNDGVGFSGAHVTLQNIVLHPEFESQERPGDSTRSSAVVFDWKSFCRRAANIVMDAARLLEPEPIGNHVPAARRLQIGRPTIELPTRPTRTVGDLSRTSLAMLAAIVQGDQLRLGASDCPDIDTFLSALADVFDVVPEPLRGHISVAAGLTLPDAALQIAWAHCLTSTAGDGARIERLFGGIDREMPLSEAGSLLFLDEQDAAFRPSGVSRDCCYAGQWISTRTNAGVMPQARVFVSRFARANDCRDARIPHRSLDCNDAVQVMSDLLASRATVAQRRALIRFVTTASPEQLASVTDEGCRRGEPAISTIAEMLCGEAPDVIDLAGLAATLTLAGDAVADPVTKRFGTALTARVRGELSAFLRSKLLFTEPMLEAIVSSDELSAMTAAVLADDDPSITARLLDSAALMELLGPHGQTLAATVRRRLTPRDGGAGRAWRKNGSDVGNKARALSLLISAEPLEQRDLSQHASALASHLIADGRRDLVVDAMRGISTRLDLCKTPESAVDTVVEQRRLDVLISLATVLRGASGSARVSQLRYR